jgi:hypothetical protein
VDPEVEFVEGGLCEELDEGPGWDGDWFWDEVLACACWFATATGDAKIIGIILAENLVKECDRSEV